MTAEIAILNKSAIALAADSKVTLSSGGKQKTYDTVNKLFAISKTEPVGVMIYGNAEFMQFPWETIIKEYRRLRPRKSFDTIFDWADDLTSYLTNFFPFTAADEEQAALSIAQAWLQRLFDICMNGSKSPEDFQAMLKAEVAASTAVLASAEDFLSDNEWAELEPRIAQGLGQALDQGIFQQFPDEREAIRNMAVLAIRKSVPSPATSGLVIAGFGEREFLPSLSCYEIDGILFGRLKATQKDRIDVTRQNRGGIFPFAQTDMVDRFMQGIDPAYAQQLHESIAGLLSQNATDVATALGHSNDQINSMMPAFENAASAAVQAFWASHERIRRERFASPIIDMAMSLPKDELANMAESLVSITSLQRRVSRELETVGGAVDVAVISKGDGFVWIKRKHYFNPDRNLRFVNGYFSEFGRELAGGNDDDNNS